MSRPFQADHERTKYGPVLQLNVSVLVQGSMYVTDALQDKNGLTDEFNPLSSEPDSCLECRHRFPSDVAASVIPLPRPRKAFQSAYKATAYRGGQQYATIMPASV